MVEDAYKIKRLYCNNFIIISQLKKFSQEIIHCLIRYILQLMISNSTSTLLKDRHASITQSIERSP